MRLPPPADQIASRAAPSRRPLVAALLGLVLSASCVPPAATPAPSPEPRFYFGRPYGSEAEFNPVTQILNEGFDALRTRGQDRHVLGRDYAVGVTSVWTSVRQADQTFRAYGWRRAARNEWFPLTTQNGNGGGAWVPNYEYHLVGSGMVSIRMEEWFAQQGAAHPALWSAATVMASHFVNEVVENGARHGLNEDPVTDLLVFDPAGLLVWRLDAVQRFFSGRWSLTNWPGQPSLDIPSHTLENVGQQYILRAPLPHVTSWKVFYDFGMSTLLGLSKVRSDGDAISAGFGVNVVDNPVVDPRTGAKGATLRAKAGVFYDRNGSLLFSLLSGSRSDLARLDANVYPGVLGVGPFRPGLWAQLADRGAVRFGISAQWGIGVGHGPER